MSGKLDYWRADNMWAAAGRPDGNLGQETVSVKEGQTRVFITDWRYEKRRNDGINYYGSHGRILSNPSTVPLYIVLSGDLRGIEAFLGQLIGMAASWIQLYPQQRLEIRNDIREVTMVKPTKFG